MADNTLTIPNGHRELVERLVCEFDGEVPQAAVVAEVHAAVRELRGQVPPGSLAELLHRLVEHRLRERVDHSAR